MATAFVYNETKRQNKNMKKTTYGSQRPVVEFIVARGQYAPNGQAVVIGDRGETRVISQAYICLILLQMSSHHNKVMWMDVAERTHGACK